MYISEKSLPFVNCSVTDESMGMAMAERVFGILGHEGAEPSDGPMMLELFQKG